MSSTHLETEPAASASHADRRRAIARAIGVGLFAIVLNVAAYYLLPPDLASGAHAPPGGSGWERPGAAPPDAQGNAPPPVHAKWAPPAS